MYFVPRSVSKESASIYNDQIFIDGNRATSSQSLLVEDGRWGLAIVSDEEFARLTKEQKAKGKRRG
jgi:hypothetical protein